MCRAALLLVAISAASASIMRAQSAPADSAPIIDTVIIITQNVFNQEEARSNLFFRFANAVHFTTRHSVVRNELLFRAGEAYDSAKVEESLRNLRRRALFRDVDVDTTYVGDRVNVTVTTGDGWTTELQLNASSTGGTFTWAAGVFERNVLGIGARAGMTYRKETNRTVVSFLGGSDRIGHTRLATDVLIENLSDGIRRAWVLGMPFRAFGERSGFTLGGRANGERILQYRDGVVFRVFRRRVFLQNARLAYALRASSAEYLRVGLVGQVKREEYFPQEDTLLAIPDTVTGAVGVFVEYVRARFKVVTHYNGFDRDVDVDLSTRFGLSALLAPTAFGYDSTGIGSRAFLQLGAGFGKNFVTFSAVANGLFSGRGLALDSGRVWAGLTAVSQSVSKQATVLHIEGGAFSGTPPGSEFDLGHGVGPRAFPPHAFTGTRALWGSLEHRAFVIDDVGGVLALGFAAFVDYGGAWFPDQRRRLGGNVGAGIRFGATRSTGPNIGRLDLAYRFGDGATGRRWVVTFGRGFFF